jgi:hypothetical protein
MEKLIRCYRYAIVPSSVQRKGTPTRKEQREASKPITPTTSTPPTGGRPNSCVTSRHFATGALLPNPQYQSWNISRQECYWVCT